MFAWIVVALRYPIVAAWIAAAVVTTMRLPSAAKAQGGSLADLVPTNTPALRTEARSLREFAFPLLSRTEVVQRNPNGLSLDVQARAAQRALRVDQHTDPSLRSIEGALPISNALGLIPGSREQGTEHGKNGDVVHRRDAVLTGHALDHDDASNGCHHGAAESLQDSAQDQHRQGLR